MNLPNPLRSDEWPQSIRLIAWATLASLALVAIMAGLGVVTTFISAQGPLLYALAGVTVLRSMLRKQCAETLRDLAAAR